MTANGVNHNLVITEERFRAALTRKLSLKEGLAMAERQKKLEKEKKKEKEKESEDINFLLEELKTICDRLKNLEGDILASAANRERGIDADPEYAKRLLNEEISTLPMQLERLVEKYKPTNRKEPTE